MSEVKTLNGQKLREMLTAATGWLEKSAAEVDALNVFPVPDGDTGTNMLLTMRSSIEEAYRAPDTSAASVAQAVARGALMGARGNSGVILSQIWNGLSKGLAEKETVTGQDLANGLAQAAAAAYRGLSNPVEGTILTVIREAAAAAQAQAASEKSDVNSVLGAAVQAAAKAVANTPNLLAVLREAGVVDAGGQGLYTILDGALRYLQGEGEQMHLRKPQMIVSNIPQQAARLPEKIGAEELPFGYCTEFLVKGEDLEPDKLRTKFNRKGQSLIVVGDDKTVRVHVHTLDPGDVIHYATSLGTLHQVSIRNMDEQHQDFLELQKERSPQVDIAIVAVASGDGMVEVFRSLGAIVVPGGQTMNPSTKELLQAVESVPSEKVIILPNNKNIIPTASQVQPLTSKKVEIIPTETIPQGVASILAFDYEADFETNHQLMSKARSSVRSVEITRAVRPAEIGGLKIKKRQVIGFLDGDLVAVGESAAEVLDIILKDKVNMAQAEVFTIYYGADTEPSEAEALGGKIHKEYPDLQTEVIKGGQPHYNYVVSIE